MAGNKDQRKPSWLSEHPFVNIALWSVAAIVLFILFLLILGGFDFRKSTFESIRTAIDPKHVTPAIAMLGIEPRDTKPESLAAAWIMRRQWFLLTTF